MTKWFCRLTSTMVTICVVVFGFGTTALGNPIDEFAQRKRTAFKREIGYDAIISGLGPDKQYIVDWDEMLRNFADAAGAEWRRRSRPSHYVAGTYGTMRLNVSRRRDTVDVHIHKVTGGQREAIDLAMTGPAYGSTLWISLKVVPALCPADFCFMNADEADEVSSMSMIKGNVLVELYSFESKTVLPIARYISEQMDKVSIDPRQSPINTLNLRLSADRSNINLGEEFVFSVEPKSLFDDEEWLVDVRPASNDELEYVKEEPGRFTYKALKKGPARITVAVMHKRTLQVKEEALVVNVN